MAALGCIWALQYQPQSGPRGSGKNADEISNNTNLRPSQSVKLAIPLYKGATKVHRYVH